MIESNRAKDIANCVNELNEHIRKGITEDSLAVVISHSLGRREIPVVEITVTKVLWTNASPHNKELW